MLVVVSVRQRCRFRRVRTLVCVVGGVLVVWPTSEFTRTCCVSKKSRVSATSPAASEALGVQRCSGKRGALKHD